MRRVISYTSLILALSLSGCGWRFPEAPWMNKDPLSFITSGPKTRVPDVDPQEESKTKDLMASKGTDRQHSTDDQSPDIFGVNLDTYFSQTLDTDERLSRLEDAVLQIVKREKNYHKNFTDSRIVSIESSLEKHDMETPHTSAQKSPLDLTPIDAGPRHINTPQTTVTGIRVGKHSSYVRIVFDVTGNTPYTVDLDNGENILVVELNGTKWQPPVMSESFGKMALLRSYKVDKMGNGNGHIFVMQLKRPTSIIQQKMYPALSGGGKRIVIDLKL